jgi:hypothetical protein
MKAVCVHVGDDMFTMYESAASGKVPSYAEVGTRGYSGRGAKADAEKQAWVKKLSDKLQLMAVRNALGNLHEGDWPVDEGCEKDWNRRVQVCIILCAKQVISAVSMRV